MASKHRIYDHNIAARIRPTGDATGLEFPTFRGFGQFDRYILSFQKQSFYTFFEQRGGIFEQFVEGRERARRHDLSSRRPARGERLDAFGMDFGGKAERLHGFAQKGRFLGLAFDQVDFAPGVCC